MSITTERNRRIKSTRHSKALSEIKWHMIPRRSKSWWTYWVNHINVNNDRKGKRQLPPLLTRTRFLMGRGGFSVEHFEWVNLPWAQRFGLVGPHIAVPEFATCACWAFLSPFSHICNRSIKILKINSANINFLLLSVVQLPLKSNLSMGTQDWSSRLSKPSV